MDLQEELDLTYLFVSHDLSVVRHISNRVAVMYLGFIVEHGETEALFRDPKHPYTQMLFSAIPTLDSLAFEDHFGLQGEVPTPILLPTGCVFHPRCPKVMDRCRTERPGLAEIEAGRRAACHLYR
jgi:peptide/nickel transport system ATP-binding protein/oligopeptide transport system ATP-binding protein